MAIKYSAELEPGFNGALIDSKFIRGGFFQVETFAELNAIPSTQYKKGMLAYVANDPAAINTYQWNGSSWVKSKIGGGVEKVATMSDISSLNVEEGDIYYVSSLKKIMVYQGSERGWQDISATGLQMFRSSQIEELKTTGMLPSEYIAIPDADELEQEAEVVETPVLNGGTASYVSTGNGTYLSILFSALRELQSEVAKIKNTYTYGMYSYTGKATAISATGANLAEYSDDEPLWATDENSLSEIANASATFNINTNLVPISSMIFNAEGTTATINGTVYWEDTYKAVSATTDAKLYMFMTISNTNCIIELDDIDGQDRTLTIDMSQFPIPTESCYNVLLIISRTVTSSGTTYGSNFIWCSIAGYDTSETIFEGYLSFNSANVCTYVASDSPITQSYRYTFAKVSMTDMVLSKLNFYSKYQDLSTTVDSIKPTDTDYRYKVAHITIRSVSDSTELTAVANQLPVNELIYNEDTGTLWIKTSSGVKTISGSSSENNSTSGMKESEIIQLLVRMGIVAGTRTEVTGTDNTTTYYYSDLHIADIADLTFIHQESGSTFNLSVDADGNLVTKELAKDGTTIESVIEANASGTNAMSTDAHVRGLSSRYFSIVSSPKQNPLSDPATDMGLNSDRVKIGAYYAPLSTDTVFGCSHAYIELENTSNKDFPLDGCYIHFLRPNPTTGVVEVLHHELSGILKAGSTYLIRGKQYADPAVSSNVFINVSDCDDEWYVYDSSKKTYSLIDLTITKNSSWKHNCYGFALTYGQSALQPDTQILSANSGKVTSAGTFTKKNYPLLAEYYYIDSLVINEHYDATNKYWGPNVDTAACVAANSNTIVKNMFELDPAKQAFQSLNVVDSSRARGAKYSNDIQYVDLTNEYITFPNSDESMSVSKYAPQSSKQNKNVCTDKTKLDTEKPNMVTCSFGQNAFTTRCFNWISTGSYDEYVWLKVGDNWVPFQSYTKRTTPVGTLSATYPRRVEFDPVVNNAVYARMYSYFPGDGTYFTSHKCIINVVSAAVSTPTTYEYRVGRRVYDKTTKSYIMDSEHVSDVYTFTLYPSDYVPQVYQITDQQGFHWIEYQVWAAAAKKLDRKINADVSADGAKIIPVLLNTGDMTQNGTRINEWFDYYTAGSVLFKHLEQVNCVGNNDLCGTTPTDLGTGDDTGKSNSYYFHLFYCYEVFDFVDSSVTGTSTQIAVSASDLVGATVDGNWTPTATDGKYQIDATKYVQPGDYVSSDEYNVALNGTTYVYTYNASETYHIRPVIKGADNVYRYIPSLYYIDFTDYRILIVNSEIKAINCRDWFKKANGTTAINIYTGWELQSSNVNTKPTVLSTAYHGDFVSIYTMLYTILSNAGTNSKRVIPACHEMPFTVITKSELYTNNKNADDLKCQNRYRSINSSSALVGSHLNQLCAEDTASIYWFSRLLEGFNVNICLGGHKHTYTCTYPIQENYIYYDTESDAINGTNPKYSYNSRMSMEKTLANDNWRCLWFDAAGLNLTKYPLLDEAPADATYGKNSSGDSEAGTYTFPYCADHTINSAYKGILYFMCQATGYKLTSNKELPSNYQVFSQVLPKTTHGASSDSPSKEQKYPMFAIVNLVKSGTGTYTYTANIKLARIDNIMKGGSFSQSVYLTGTPYLQYAVAVANSRYCGWNNTSSGSESTETENIIVSTTL